MDFSWTPEQRESYDAALAFARDALSEDIAERDREGTFSRELWDRCAEFGLHGLPFPASYGGSETDVLTMALVMEAIGYGCKDQGLLFSINAHMWGVAMPIHTFGTEGQKGRYLEKLCRGRWVGAHAMSEPDSGSDAYALRTHAVKHGDRYVLNGSKIFITNAPQADLFVVFATVDPTQKMWGVTAFLLERDTPGLTVSPPVEKMGLRTALMGELTLEDVEASEDDLLGAPGQGAPIFSHSMGWERSCILATTVGGMQRQLDSTLAWVKSRKQFGKPIGEFQLVASKIVDMKLRLELSRLLLRQAAWHERESGMSRADAAMAKLFISESSVASAMDAIQVRGAYGYLTEHEVERDLRDAIGSRIYSGTSEIQRLIIAGNLGLTA
jgi:alkylation response protein AidB-like acyl-CoA dehydrogenase